MSRSNIKAHDDFSLFLSYGLVTLHGTGTGTGTGNRTDTIGNNSLCPIPSISTYHNIEIVQYILYFIEIQSRSFPCPAQCV